MSKPIDRAGRHPALRQTRDPRRLLDRILDTPHLAEVVPRLRPEVLHRIVQRCGLEDCAEFVALATPGQLSRVFDLDLWRARKSGLDEELDADRFGVWLEVLMESGAAVAAQKLIGIDVDLLIAAFAQHMLVFDRAAVSRSGSCEIGGYLLEAKRTDAWDTIVDLLLFLDAEHRDFFHRVMRGCRRLSNSRPEDDGLHQLLTDNEQDMFDLAIDRETRREKEGYVAPAQARAFLQMARELPLGHAGPPPANPVARAYFRAIELTPPSSEANADHGADMTAAVMDLLIEEGVVSQQPRALLTGPQGPAPRLARIQAQLQFARDRDAAAYSTRTEEFAYLANTLMAGGSIQARPFTSREASDAAAAVCNLGLENWPARWRTGKGSTLASAAKGRTALPDDFLITHDLVGVFQVGWAVLYSDVSMYAAQQLLELLSALRIADRDVQAGLETLRLEMSRHWRAGAPWSARDALDVIMILDQPAWAALVGLIDQCPVIHAAIDASRRSGARAVSASAFEFISENSQIASVREFLQRLPEILRG